MSPQADHSLIDRHCYSQTHSTTDILRIVEITNSHFLLIIRLIFLLLG